MFKKYITHIILAIAGITPAYAENAIIAEVKELEFKNQGDEETVYKDGALFSGAVVLPDEDGHQITYFYRGGKKHGVAASHFEDGQMELEITYRKGVKDGEEILFYENGNPKYKKTYKNNKLNGEYVLFYENGKPQQQSRYKDDKLNGEVNYFDEDGNRTKIEHYKDDLKNGIEHIIAGDRLLEENNYKNGILNGVTKKYNEKYLTDEITYVNGIKEGPHVTYLENGSRTEIPYRNDMKSGIGTAYYPEGLVVNKVSFYNDMKNGLSEKFYKNGIRSSAENYRNDKLDGISRTFNDKGELLTVSYYADGVELAKIDIAKDTELNEIYEAYKKGQLNVYSIRKNLWYPILWLGISAENTEIINAIEKEMKMYGETLDNADTYKKANENGYNEYKKRLFGELTPLSYAINIYAPIDILQRLATTSENIEEINLLKKTNALQEAVRLNDLEMVKYLLALKADLTKKDANGATIVLYAVKEQIRPEIIEELLQAGADVDAQDNDGNSAILLAADQQNSDYINLLIKYGADLQKQTPEGKTLLFYAYEKELPTEIIDQILSAGADVNKKDKEENVLLMQAIKAGDSRMVKALLQNGADVNLADGNKQSAATYVTLNPVNEEITAQVYAQDIDVKNNLGEKGKTLWKYAYEKNRADLLKIIFDKMGGVEKEDINGEIPLYTVLSDVKNTVMTDLALSYVDKASDKLLWTAVQSRNLPLLQKVVDKKADVNAVNADGDTVLLYMIKNKYDMPYLQMVETSKIKINDKDRVGNDALWLAIAADNLPLAENLIALGANVNQTRDGDSYLMLLTSTQENMTNLLLKNKADINYQTPQGHTMLMKAVWQLNITLIKHLLEQGVNLKTRDEDGSSAFLYLAEAAQKYADIPEDELVAKFKEVAELLLAKGEDVNVQNGNGETLLIRLAQKKLPVYEKLAEVLRNMGINAALKDQYGKTAENYL